jgi:hypothetical protein
MPVLSKRNQVLQLFNRRQMVHRKFQSIPSI